MSERAAERIRVGLVDDHRPVREAIRRLLASEPDIDAVGEAGTRMGALALADRARPDVLLLDLQLPDGPGLTAIEELRERLPKVRVVVVTMLADPQLRGQALAAGAAGFLLKDSPPEDLLDAVRRAARE